MKEIKKIVNDLIKKECRAEALEILSKSSEQEVQKIIDYYNKDNEIACCMHLDYLKNKLIKNGIMKDGGCFGGDLFGMDD